VLFQHREDLRAQVNLSPKIDMIAGVPRGGFKEPLQNLRHLFYRDPVLFSLVFLPENHLVQGRFQHSQGWFLEPFDENLRVHVDLGSNVFSLTARILSRDRLGYHQNEAVPCLHLLSVPLTAWRIPQGLMKGRYNRVLGLILLDGRNINLEMIEAGLAEVYRGKPAGGLTSELSGMPRGKPEKHTRACGSWGTSIENIAASEQEHMDHGPPPLRGKLTSYSISGGEGEEIVAGEGGACRPAVNRVISHPVHFEARQSPFRQPALRYPAAIRNTQFDGRIRSCLVCACLPARYAFLNHCQA
jgi:hypothetical protein